MHARRDRGTLRVRLLPAQPCVARVAWYADGQLVGSRRLWHRETDLFLPAGRWTLEVTDDKVVLPRGLHRGKPLVVTPKDVTAVYFLRRSVPWKHASPVLVVELGDKAMVFPRDWFATEADQRHVVHALLAYLRPAA